jgi:methionyl aminopeptidase
VGKRKRRNSGSVAELPPPGPPVLPGLVSPRRTVPAGIGRPPYATTGDPGPSRSSVVRTPDEIVRMRKACQAAAIILVDAGQHVRPGISTDEIDRIVHDKTVELGGYPSPLGYRGFPKSVCTSVNEVICHGIPDSRRLADGDIVNIDVTIYLDGVHGDMSATFLVGDVDERSVALVRETRIAMEKGIDEVRAGRPINVIGRAIEQHAREHELGVVREFIGHGIGTEFHTALQIPHYYEPRARREIEVGMTFTVEPMLTIGDPSLGIWEDDWTAVTLDGHRSAQFEHTLLVTEDGAERLTLLPDGASPADLFAPFA